MDTFSGFQIAALELGELGRRLGGEAGKVAVPALQYHVLVEQNFLIQPPAINVASEFGEGVGVESLPDLPVGMLLVMCLGDQCLDGFGRDGKPARNLSILLRGCALDIRR